jgi:hypothetical protein
MVDALAGLAELLLCGRTVPMIGRNRKQGEVTPQKRPPSISTLLEPLSVRPPQAPILPVRPDRLQKRFLGLDHLGIRARENDTPTRRSPAQARRRAPIRPGKRPTPGEAAERRLVARIRGRERGSPGKAADAGAASTRNPRLDFGPKGRPSIVSRRRRPRCRMTRHRKLWLSWQKPSVPTAVEHLGPEIDTEAD